MTNSAVGNTHSAWAGAAVAVASQ